MEATAIYTLYIYQVMSKSKQTQHDCTTCVGYTGKYWTQTGNGKPDFTGLQMFLNLSGNVGAGVHLGCTISWECLLDNYYLSARHFLIIIHHGSPPSLSDHPLLSVEMQWVMGDTSSATTMGTQTPCF